MNGIIGNRTSDYAIQQNIREKTLTQDAQVRHLNRVHAMDDKRTEKQIHLTTLLVHLLKRLGGIEVEWKPQMNRALTASQVTAIKSGKEVKAVMVPEKKSTDS